MNIWQEITDRLFTNLHTVHHVYKAVLLSQDA